MFNFMKKASVGMVAEEGEREEKERRKKEKKERKEKQKRDRGGMSAEELLRIDEVRRSLKLRGRRKEKEKLPSGITADYSASFFAELDRDSNYSNLPLGTGSEGGQVPTPAARGVWRDGFLQSDSSETSLNSLNNPNGLSKQPPSLPPLPPRPPKRGILKGPRLSSGSSSSSTAQATDGSNHPGNDATDYINLNGQDVNLIENTLRNEVIAYQNLPRSNGASNHDDLLNLQNFTKKVIHSPVDANGRANYYNSYGLVPPPITVTNHDNQNGNGKENGTSNLCHVTSASPSAESLTDTTTNSSFATPPFSMSPTGDSDGFHRWSTNLEGMNLPLPEITPPELPAPRTLTIQRQKPPRNDFGFSLRRAMIVEHCGQTNGTSEKGLSDDEDKEMGCSNGVRMKAVIFAEPGALSSGHETGLLPGDRLLEVNGVCVDDKSREEIIEMIKGSHESVTVKVQPVAELSEVWRRWAALPDEDSSIHPRVDLQPQDEQEEESPAGRERVWVCHRGGFTLAEREAAGGAAGGAGDSPRARVRLLHSQDTLEVDDDDLEKANPAHLDRVEDLAGLRFLNESSALHAVRQRYSSHLVHTAVGQGLLLLSPVNSQLTIYSDKVAAMLKGCKQEDLPPHLFSVIQRAHRSALASRTERAVVFIGRARSGKGAALRRAAGRLAAQGGPAWAAKIPAALAALSAASCRAGASRSAHALALYYDQAGALASATLHAHMLLPSTDVHYDIYHWVIQGCEGSLRRLLLLEGAASRGSGEDAINFCQLTVALRDLSITEAEQLVLWKALAAIYHLSAAGATKVPVGGSGGARYQFADPAAGNRAAQLLGCCSEELVRALFSHPAVSGGLGTPTQSRGAFRTPSPIERGTPEMTGQEAVEGLITGLYTEFFNCLVALINRSLTTNARTVSSLLLVDPPGLGGACSSGGGVASGAAGLWQLAANYLHERLQLLAHERTVLQPRQACRQEGIALDDDDSGDWIAEVMNPGPMVELLDRAPQNSMVRTSQADLRDADRKGLLWLLDEESMHPGASDASFIERAVAQWGGCAAGAQHTLLRRGALPLHLVLHHMQGTYPVMYNASGWLKASRENPISRNAIGLLQESTNEDVSRLFVWSRGLCGAGPDAQASLRRASSIRRTLTTGTVVVNRRSLVAQIQAGAEGVLGALRRTKPCFVFCALANRAAPGSPGAPIDVPLLRSQFRGFQLLEAARMYKQGFPDSLPFAEFARRFRLLAVSEGAAVPVLSGPTPPEEQRRLVAEMLRCVDLDPSLYRIGLSQVSLIMVLHLT